MAPHNLDNLSTGTLLVEGTVILGLRAVKLVSFEEEPNT